MRFFLLGLFWGDSVPHRVLANSWVLKWKRDCHIAKQTLNGKKKKKKENGIFNGVEKTSGDFFFSMVMTCQEMRHGKNMSTGVPRRASVFSMESLEHSRMCRGEGAGCKGQVSRTSCPDVFSWVSWRRGPDPCTDLQRAVYVRSPWVCLLWDGWEFLSSYTFSRNRAQIVMLGFILL